MAEKATKDAEASLRASLSPSEKSARSRRAEPTSPPSKAPKACAVCRARKVKCDKSLPCSNCRRANIACVLPSTDRRPRWARRLQTLPGSTPSEMTDDQTMGRLQHLERLVQDLRTQLEEARSGTSPAANGSSDVYSSGNSIRNPPSDHPSPLTDATSVNKQFGRLVLQNTNDRHYVSSGFWSRVDDEVDDLDLEPEHSATSEDETLPEGTPPAGVHESPSPHMHLFPRSQGSAHLDLREFYPLPSQIPFLADIFAENVNIALRVVHNPSLTSLVQASRGNGMARFTPSNEALMFSIFYSAVISMEEDDIVANFGSTKADLGLKYRTGLEYAFAKADFLSSPDVTLLQAFCIFLCLARRHDSPRFVWMMTGLAIRMAHYLGLQRDGTHFEHLTPFEIEMRRRLWWLVCHLDVRASEDQGTDLTITSGGFDTKVPLNINDDDISPETKEMPTERNGVADMTFSRINSEVNQITRQMSTYSKSTAHQVTDLEEYKRLLDEVYQQYDRQYFQYTTTTGNIYYSLNLAIARLVMAKLALIHLLPILYSSPTELISDEIRTTLLISAIEVAEYNHVLNTEEAYRPWRWLYQTHTHWHAIVYLMLELSRRPWSATVERGWVALHSSWLIPARRPVDKDVHIWVPLRRLMDRARRHRDRELQWLRADPQAAADLATQDENMPVPSSSGPFQSGSSVEKFRERWRRLIDAREALAAESRIGGLYDGMLANSSAPVGYEGSSPDAVASAPSQVHTSSNVTSSTVNPGQNDELPASGGADINFGTFLSPHAPVVVEQPVDSFSTLPADWADDKSWLWADAGLASDTIPSMDFNAGAPYANVDLDSEMDWYSWLVSAKGMEWDGTT